jgi:hypothetical protein
MGLLQKAKIARPPKIVFDFKRLGVSQAFFSLLFQSGKFTRKNT